MGSGADCCKTSIFDGKERVVLDTPQRQWVEKTKDSSKANERQVGGTHYKTGKSEHWDIVVDHNLDYFQAQILRYVMRWNKKDGIKDLKKAQHFLQKYLEVIEEGRILDPTVKSSQCKHEEHTKETYPNINEAKAHLASTI